MRILFLFVVLAAWLSAAPSLNAFPPIIAKKILGRPTAGDDLESQLGMFNGFLDPIIEGSDAIAVSHFSVGSPRVKLSVLIVEPRHYGIEFDSQIDTTENELGYSLEINSSNHTPPESWREQMGGAEFDGEDEEAMKRFLALYAEWMKEAARKGGQKPSTTRPRTLFLLNGYGVPKKVGLPLALLLAEHGIRTVIPDLRGQGDSGGRRITWGKEEPGDLSDLLTTLQASGVVEREPVAVMGISYGAAMASLWSARDARVRATILVAPYQQADTKIIEAYDKLIDVSKLPFKLSEKKLSRGTALAARRLRVDWEELAPTRAVQRIRTPVLFMASTGDEIMPRKEVAALHRLAPEGSKLHVFEKLPHSLLGLNFTEMEALVVDWLETRGFQSL